MKCWDCGQELDTTEIERNARILERCVIAEVVYRGADLFRDRGDTSAYLALHSLAEELRTSPVR